MPDEIKPNAYRAIIDDVLPLYTEDPEQIPDLTGEHFSMLGKGNNHDYVPEKKYLHFFPKLDSAQSYANALASELGKKVSVVGFHFDQTVLDNFKFVGKYRTDGYYISFLELDEYIIPIELYDPNLNYLGVVSKGEVKKKDYDPDDYSEGWQF